MDHIWAKIKEDVAQHRWVAMEEWPLSENVFLTKEKAFDMLSGGGNRSYCNIDRRGDLVVGFYLDEDATSPRKLALESGAVEILQDLVIHPGQFVYFFKNTVFPILSIQYSETHLRAESYDDLYIIYAIINDIDIRREIGTGTHIVNKCAIIRGHFGYVEDIDRYIQQNPNHNGIYIHLPNLA